MGADYVNETEDIKYSHEATKIGHEGSQRRIRNSFFLRDPSCLTFVPSWQSLLYEPFGNLNFARNTCVVLSFVRLLVHIKYFPSAENVGSKSAPSLNVIRVFRFPSSRIRYNS